MFQKGMAEAVAARAASQTMNTTGKSDDQWAKIQQKTFTNWVNTQVYLHPTMSVLTYDRSWKNQAARLKVSRRISSLV